MQWNLTMVATVLAMVPVLVVLVATGFQRMFAGWLDVTPEDVRLDHVGLNHSTWIRHVWVGGRDRLPGLLVDHGHELAERLELPRSLLDRLGVVPSYYLRNYYPHDEVVRELKATGTRAEEVLRIEAELLEMHRDPAAYEDLALRAARLGGRDRVFDALLAHPLVGQYDVAETLTDALLAGNQEFLPWARS